MSEIETTRLEIYLKSSNEIRRLAIYLSGFLETENERGNNDLGFFTIEGGINAYIGGAADGFIPEEVMSWV